MKTYLYHVLIALDQLINTLLAGHADETLSSRAWRAYTKPTIFGKIFKPLIDGLFYLFEKDHCYHAYMSELNRKQFPSEFQKL